MTVELLLVLFLEAEQNLDRASVLTDFTSFRDDSGGGVPAVVGQFRPLHGNR